MFAGARARAASEVASSAGISRQAAHRHLAALTAEGLLGAEGRGRSVRYRNAGSLPFTRRYPRAVIAEDRVWQEVSSDHPAIGHLFPDALSIFNYAFTEMLNNAIEHSASKDVGVELKHVEGGLALRSWIAGVAYTPTCASCSGLHRTWMRFRS